MSSPEELPNCIWPYNPIPVKLGENVVYLTPNNMVMRTFALGSGDNDYCIYTDAEGVGRVFQPGSEFIEELEKMGFQRECLEELDEAAVDVHTSLIQRRIYEAERRGLTA